MNICTLNDRCAGGAKPLSLLLRMAATGALGLAISPGFVSANTVTIHGANGTSSSINGGQAIATANATADADHIAHAYGGGSYLSGTAGDAQATATDGASGSFSPSAGSYTASLGGNAGNDAVNPGGSALSTSNASNNIGNATATGYAQGGIGSKSFGASNVSAANGGQGGSATTNVTATNNGANDAYAAAVGLGGSGGSFYSIFTPSANSGLGGSSQVSSVATASGIGSATSYGISYGGPGGTFAGSNGNGTGGNGGSGSLGNVSASSNGGYVFVEGALIGGAGGGTVAGETGAGSVTGGNGADATLTNAVSGTTSGHSELIEIAEGGAAGGGSVAAGTAGSGNASFTSSITSGSVSNAGIEAYASGGAGGYLHSTTGSATAGGTATSVANGTNNTGASGVAAYSIAGTGGTGATGAAGGMGGNATATSTSNTSLAGAAVTAIGYAVGGNGGNSSNGTASGGSAIAKATANLNGGYVNSYAQAVGGSPGSGGAGINSATALADAYANNAAAGAINAQAVMTDTPSGQTANIQSDLPVSASFSQLHTESYINAGQTPRAISSAAGANVATLLTQDPTNAEATSLLASNSQASANWNIGGTNTAQPGSTVTDYNQVSFISAGTSSSNTQYHSLLTVTTPNVNLSTAHDEIMSFLGATSAGTGSVIIQVTNLNTHTLLLNNGYGTLALADTATSDTTFDLGSIASLVSSSNTLELQMDVYLFTTDPTAAFQTGFIFGNSIMGSGPAASSMSTTNIMRASSRSMMTMGFTQSVATPEPASLALLALGTLGAFYLRRSPRR